MRAGKRWASALSLTAVAVGLGAPQALASYNNWGVLYAYEGSTLVAEGKGSAGVDYNLDVIGGHATSYDPRPGGSPAYAKIRYQYTQPALTGYYYLRAGNNYTASWRDKFVTGNLNTSYTQAELNGMACQDDDLGPDACKTGPTFNQAWP
jgi:hypothetical protein